MGKKKKKIKESKAEVSEALKILSNYHKGVWIVAEHLIEYENGATLLLRGYDCPFCGNFINRKSGKQNFCHKCGADLREEATDDTENQ